jgi:Fe-S-cluster-containing dehydrogenase component/CRP-like cAMP-binding protein
MRYEQVELLLQRPEFMSIDESRFPASIPLYDILFNDCCIREYSAGDLVIREGDYGNSAFLLMSGLLRVVINPGLPSRLLGRSSLRKKSLWRILSQIWQRNTFPEARQINVDKQQEYAKLQVNLHKSPDAKAAFDFSGSLPRLKDKFQSALLHDGAIVGEIAALGRVQRTATVYAETKVTVLEIRWQGLRDLRKYSSGWRELIDKNYRDKMLKAKLASHPDFSGLGKDILEKIAQASLFETYGGYEWTRSYRKEQAQGSSSIIGSEAEPWVAHEGDYADGLLLIGAGFARISTKLGYGHRSLGYLKAGDYFGLEELYTAWKTGEEQHSKVSLSALGYLHVLRIPAHVLQRWVFPNIKSVPVNRLELAQRPVAADAVMEWAIDERFINGTHSMVIDMDHCVRCDDCVRACERGHEGNPRFIRHGKTQGKWMVAHACMHCVDPVCMIGCPTGAIHRTATGVVIINDATCIGCATCANSCPYDNIQMVEIRDTKGRRVNDPSTGTPIVKATKCDLCASLYGGPACVRACPHGALQRIDFNSSDWLDSHP